MFGGDVEATNHSLDYLLEHLPEEADHHSKKIAIEPGKQVLAIAKARDPYFKLELIEAGFPPEMTDDQCHALMDEMTEVSIILAGTIDLIPDPPSPSRQADDEAMLSDVGSSPPAA